MEEIKSQKDIWLDNEKKILALVKANVYNLQKHSPVKIEIDDFIQEGLTEVFKKLDKHNSNRGKIETFINTILQNKFYTLIQKSVKKSSIPRVWVQTINGCWLDMPCKPISLDDIDTKHIKNNSVTPFDNVESNEMENLTEAFKASLFNTLESREQKVLQCLINPEKEILDIDGSITISNIAKFLNVDNNSVSWSINKIKKQFTKLARKKEFEDIYGDKIKSNDWPIVHLSFNEGHDYKFIEDVFKKRNLKTEHIADYYKSKDFCNLKNGATCARWIETFVWGSVLIAKYKNNWVTAVIEGKFNPISGIVKGKKGTREKISIPWYNDLVKELRKI